MAFDNQEYRNNLFSSKSNDTFSQNTHGFDMQPDQKCDFGDFQEASDKIDLIDKDEQENRLEFDLSVNPNDLNQTKNNAAANKMRPSNEQEQKWWTQLDLNQLQHSKLEVSSMSAFSHESDQTMNMNNKSCLAAAAAAAATSLDANNSVSSRIPVNQSLTSKRQTKGNSELNLDHSPSKRSKHKVDVSDYFSGKSIMPDFPKSNKNQSLPFQGLSNLKRNIDEKESSTIVNASTMAPSTFTSMDLEKTVINSTLCPGGGGGGASKNDESLK
jgi:hypothetical protein